MKAGKLFILIVEDEPEISRFIAASLENHGYSVDTAETGALALKLSAAHPPNLIILDLGLPDMDGKNVISQLRQWTRTPIIVLSARDREEEKVKALELGADDYLTKPFGMGELMARIGVALRHATSAFPTTQDHKHKQDLAIDLMAFVPPNESGM